METLRARGASINDAPLCLPITICLSQTDFIVCL